MEGSSGIAEHSNADPISTELSIAGDLGGNEGGQALALPVS